MAVVLVVALCFLVSYESASDWEKQTGNAPAFERCLVEGSRSEHVLKSMSCGFCYTSDLIWLLFTERFRLSDAKMFSM